MSETHDGNTGWRTNESGDVVPDDEAVYPRVRHTDAEIREEHPETVTAAEARSESGKPLSQGDVGTLRRIATEEPGNTEHTG